MEAYGADPENEKLAKRYSDAEDKMNQEDAWTAESDVKTILTQLHISDWNQQVGTLSGGQLKRVGLAQVLIQAPDLLILDEPTNHLDFDSIEWLQSYLASYKGALLVVTHDRYFLDQIASRIIELSFGKLYFTPETIKISLHKSRTRRTRTGCRTQAAAALQKRACLDAYRSQGQNYQATGSHQSFQRIKGWPEQSAG